MLRVSIDLCLDEGTEQEKWFDLEIWGRVYEGGSSRWGSDEPPWTEVEINEMYDNFTNSELSVQDWNRVIDEYGDKIDELLVEANYGL
jgi:hypothetical protein